MSPKRQKMVLGPYINVYMAMTNGLGIPTLHKIYHSRDRHKKQTQILVAATMLSSFFMHLSETKHHLPGIAPFHVYSWYFLQWDRIMASIMVAVGVYKVEKKPISKPLLGISAIGLVCMFLAENIEGGYLWFTIFHSIWHAVAYYLMYRVM